MSSFGFNFLKKSANFSSVGSVERLNAFMQRYRNRAGVLLYGLSNCLTKLLGLPLSTASAIAEASSTSTCIGFCTSMLGVSIVNSRICLLLIALIAMRIPDSPFSATSGIRRALA